MSTSHEHSGLTKPIQNLLVDSEMHNTFTHISPTAFAKSPGLL